MAPKANVKKSTGGDWVLRLREAGDLTEDFVGMEWEAFRMIHRYHLARLNSICIKNFYTLYLKVFFFSDLPQMTMPYFLADVEEASADLSVEGR